MKKIICALLVLMLIAGFVACGGSETDAPTAPRPAASAPTPTAMPEPTVYEVDSLALVGIWRNNAPRIRTAFFYLEFFADGSGMYHEPHLPLGPDVWGSFPLTWELDSDNIFTFTVEIPRFTSGGISYIELRGERFRFLDDDDNELGYFERVDSLPAGIN